MLLPLHNNGLNLSPPLLTGISTSHRPHFAEYRRHAYMGNGWDPVYRWDGYEGVMVLAGIEGPEQEAGTWVPVPVVQPYVAGETTIGIHRVRYRYMDSRTGYVSNPSESVEINVLEDKVEYPFAVEAAPGAGTLVDIRLSTDPKVDRIVLEATVADGTFYFLVGDFPHDGTTIVYSVGDAALEQSFLPWDDDGHDVPPIGRWILSHRERLWIYSQVVHSTGNCIVSNGSTIIPSGTIDPDWRASALGDKTVTPELFASVQWLFQVDGDERYYEIDFYNESLNNLVLADAAGYQGLSAGDVSYRIFSRSNVLWVSNPGFPEGFRPLTFIQGPQGPMSGEITACVGYGQSLVIFSNASMHRLTWDLGPQVDPVLVPVSTVYGALTQRVVVNVEQDLYTMDRRGFHSFTGVNDNHLSREVDKLLELIDFSRADLFHAVYLPRTRSVRWHVCYYEDETYPRHYFQFDIDTRSWGVGEFDVGIAESQLCLTPTGPRVLLGDERGWLWYGDTGTCDGLRGEDSHLVVGPGATLTTFNAVRDDLSDAVFGMSGAVAHWIEGNEKRYVYANNNQVVTTDPWSSPPAEGDRIKIGSVNALLKTKAFAAPQTGPREVARQDYAWLLFEPSTEKRTARVRLFEDGSPVAKDDWGNPDDREDTGVEGVTFPGKIPGYPTTDWLVDLQAGGTRRIPLGESWKRTVELEIEFDEPDSDVQLYGVELSSPDTHERLS